MNYRTGQWIVLPTESRIKNTVSNQISRLSPRDMDLLVFFLERPNTTISLQMLVDEIWNGRVVSDHAIYRVINKVRKHLDPENKDAFIETLPKRGYRFIRAVSIEYMDEQVPSISKEYKHAIQAQKIEKQSLDSNTNIDVKAVENPEHYSSPSNKNLGFIAMLTTGLILLYLIWVYWYKPSVYTGEVKVYRSFQPFEARTGFKAYPNISENGRFVVYSYKASADEHYRLKIRDLALERSESIQIDNNDEIGEFDDIQAVVNSNGNNIVFIRNGIQDCKVVHLRRFQGAYISQNLLNCLGNRDMDIAINPAGTHLYYSYRDSVNNNKSIFSMVINTGERRQLTGLQNNLDTERGSDESLVYVGNENSLYYIRDIGSQRVVYSYSFRERLSKEIFRTREIISVLDYRNKFNDLTYIMNSQSIFQYSLKYATHSEISSSISERISSYDINPISDELLLNLQTTANTFISRLITTSSPTKYSKVVLLQSEFDDRLPKKIPNTRDFLFISDRSGVPEIWRRTENGEVAKISNVAVKGLNNWMKVNRNADFLVTYSDKGILEIDLATKVQNILVSSDAYPESKNPTYSYDGQSIFFASTKSGDVQLYQYTKLDGSIRQVSDSGIITYYDRGEKQYAIKAHRTGLWEISGEDELQVLPKLSKNSINALAFSEKGIFYIKHPEQKVVFHPYELLYIEDAGFDTDIYIDNNYFALDADENRLLLFERLNLSSNIITSHATND